MTNEFTSTLSSLFGGGSSGGAGSGIVSGITTFMWIFVYAIFALLIGLIIFQYARYNIIVHLRTMDGNRTLNIRKVKARYFLDKKNGVKGIMVRWKKKTVPNIPIEYRQRMKNKDFYEFLVDSNDNLHPIKPTQAEDGKMVFLRPEPQDMKHWAHWEKKDLEERIKKGSSLKDFILQAMPLWAGLIAFLILFFFFKHIGEGMNGMAGAWKEMAQECSKLIK